MEQKPPRILQAKTSFHTIIGFLSATSFIQNLLKKPMGVAGAGLFAVAADEFHILYFNILFAWSILTCLPCYLGIVTKH